MSENWAAVAATIVKHLNLSGMTQQQLIARSRVSKAIVGELQNNSAQRHRSVRTLESISTALGLHPGHLHAVLNNQKPLPPSQAQKSARWDGVPLSQNPLELARLRQRVRRLGTELYNTMRSLNELDDAITAAEQNLKQHTDPTGADE
ncbi:XRE family transcriptional regulator [Actinokineospora sp. NBRC 105648]|uniref:XRE family transcriptional regulator n=1 Tax=Actinokineospora sp. NBRC 105648 TaxID=3032206 RepID=UPI00249FD9B5|nr:XRE family transcriptional regulator [Actinokineospora sp. NBRC 105648]GLZ42830.1 hypothetical protein Acsp05_64540 [Actinokineospora sp. NBRC 105648]